MKKQALFMFLFLPILAHAEPKQIGPFSFGKGLNLQTSITDIDDAQSCDMCNLVSNADGSASKRNGSERYITQARSSQPVVSLYRAFASTGTTLAKVLIAVMGNEIVYSTDDVSPQWIQTSSGIHAGQHWSFVTMGNRVIMTGDGLLDPIKSFNIFTGSTTNLFVNDSATEAVKIRAKYLVQAKNYLLFVNCGDFTTSISTYYPSRVWYSLLNQPSSTSWNRYIDVRTNDGEELTGAGVMFGRVNFFKPSSIHDLTFTNLNLPSQSGDQDLQEIVNGFGLIAPRVLQNLGLYYVLGSHDSIRFWDGGQRSRLTVSEETRPISNNIKPLLDKLIKFKTYQRMVCKYYKKKEWLMFAYEDPDKFPKGRNNSVLIYDLKNDEWYPACNWLADSFETYDGQDDNGRLVYGDSMDSYVHLADLEGRIDDSRKEIVLDTLDSPTAWNGSNQDVNNVREGTASLRLWVTPSITVSTMTANRVFPVGEWYDKTKITNADKIQFKILTTSISNISSVRMDLLVNGIENFDTNFTSVTFSSAVLSLTNNVWSTIEVPISSFPIRSDWTDLSIESVPFANTLTYYGIRFVVTGVSVSSVSFDDLRIVEKTENPNNFYRFTKLFNLGTMSFKTFGQLLLTADKAPDSSISMDLYNDFGKKNKTINLDAEIPQEMIVLGWISTASISIHDSADFSVKQSTTFNYNAYLPMNGVADKDYIYFSDRSNHRIVKMGRSKNFGSVVATYGAFGSGTTNFFLVHQMDLNESDKSIDLVDCLNHRMKSHSQSDLSFIRMAGSLGTGTTNFHLPTAITSDDSSRFIADEGNYRLMKFNGGASTFAFESSISMDYNIIGETTMDTDDNFLYLAYHKVAEGDINSTEVFLEKRSKGDMGLVTRVKVMPENRTDFSTYTVVGDIALKGKYIYIPFTDNGNFDGSAKYYVQKRLKSNFELVDEYRAPRKIFSVLGDAYAHKPSTKNYKKDLQSEGKYIQIKYYDSGVQNDVKLLNQTFLVDPQPAKY